MRILVSIAFAAAAAAPLSAFASADAPEPPRPDPADAVRGPFASPAAYCGFRGDAACELHPWGFDPDTAPADRPAAALRAIRFVTIGDTWHVLIRTSRGWYGRAIGDASNGDSLDVETISFTDRVPDPDRDVFFEIHTSHEPCGCGDPHFDHWLAMVCRDTGDGVECTDPIATQVDDAGADIVTWTTDWTVGKDGVVVRRLHDVRGLSARDRRRLARPLRLQFH